MSTSRPPAPADEPSGGFFSRWSRRKAEARQADASSASAPPSVLAQAAGGAASAVGPVRSVVSVPAAVAPRGVAGDGATGPGPGPGADADPGVAEAHGGRPPAPTFDDVARLDRDSDYTRFVTPDVAPGVRNAALKKLFSDPHFNVMDGLDIYIDDYSQPDPIPAAMLRQLAQSRALGLFADEAEGGDVIGGGPPTSAERSAAAAPVPAGAVADAPAAAAATAATAATAPDATPASATVGAPPNPATPPAA